MSVIPIIPGRKIVFVGGGLVIGGSIRKLPRYYGVVDNILQSINRDPSDWDEWWRARTRLSVRYSPGWEVATASSGYGAPSAASLRRSIAPYPLEPTDGTTQDDTRRLLTHGG